jgi:hypothetical protein
MGDVVFINSTGRKKDEGMQALWQAYQNAREKAETTHDILDGIAAGKAWARWLAVFTARAS